MTLSPAKSVSLVAAVAVVVGFASLPYGYYMLLRLLLCGVSLFLLFGTRLVLADWHRWVLGGLAVLYNPVLPIRIGDKAIWEVLNVATAILFWFVSRRQER